jgi:hypothetical protein
VIALHEPINPAVLEGENANQAKAEIQLQIEHFDHAIQHGLPFEHGDKGGLDIDNPVGLAETNGIRQVTAKRGEVQLAPRVKDSYQLIIKQNALFTALLPELSKSYSMVCIVRNPVDVFLSWLTINLPINRGHIPAGERFDSSLKSSLVGLNKINRQLVIYQWFISKFLSSGLPIIRYEDVIASGGAVLDKALGLSVIEREKLNAKERTFDKQTLAILELALPRLLEFELGSLYTKQDIQLSFDRVTDNGFLPAQE